jgi:hypothetical protein
MLSGMWWRRNGGSAALLVSLGMIFGCSRTAQIAPRELPRLHAYPRSETDAPIAVRTLEGRTVGIRPNFKFVRVVPRAGTEAPETVLHPPFRAQVYGDALIVEDRQPFSYQPYRLADLESVEVVQRDADRGMPLLVGALLGVAVGALVGVVASETCDPGEASGEMSLCGEPAGSALFGGVVGGGLGVLVAIPFSAANKYY